MSTIFDKILPLAKEKYNKCLEKAKIRSIGERVKEYEVNDKVMCRNYSDHGSKWISGLIMQKLSPVTYLVKCGEVWKRHINQIIDRVDKHELAIPETVNDNTIVTSDPDIDNSKLIKSVLEFKDLCNEISKLIGKDKFFCKSSTDQLKIQTATPEAYRLLVHYLKSNNAQYHTYQLTQDKPIRVVIRNIHPSTDINGIKKELTELSFVVIQVTNVLHKTTKLPLPLFFVDLEKSEKSLEIFKLPSLLYTKIKVEEPYKPKTISQCQNCQDYGHTRSYCGYPPRCVRCGNSHLTSDCTKPRDSPAKCALCLGNHLANYRGCNVFKELQRRNKPNNKSKFLHDIVNLNHSNNNNFNVKENHPLPTNNKPNTHSHPKTYAQATSNETTNTCHSNHSSPTLDINKTMSDFFENFKSLINPLIALLIQVISSILNNKNDK
ncbi:hypothetical protein QTP88_013998 [Uroleucon formosanum]